MTLIKSISGIRGTIGGRAGEGLTPVDIVKFTAAYGSWILSKKKTNKIVLGRDARISGEMLRNLVVGTLQSIGIDVIDLGLSTTPTVEIAVPLENAGGGIILTASHNPKEWNALKLLNDKGEFMWPGFGENMRVLKWIVERCSGKASAVECPIGWRPRYRDLDWNGLGFDQFKREEFHELQRIDSELWKQELLGHEELFEKLYDRLPKEFLFMRQLLLSALWRSPNEMLAPERH